MAAPTDRTALRNARAAFQSARLTLLGAIDAVGTTAAALEAAQRQFAPGRPELLQAQQNASTAVTNAATARAGDKTARANVLTAITAWLNSVSVDDDMARLSTSFPLVLFPVRIETRFDLNPTAPVMRLRIYPDEIYINLLETALTRDEYNAAINYYTQRDKGINEHELWRQMVQLMTSERAAYVLRTMSPTVTGGTTTTGGTGTTGGHSLVFPSNIIFKPGDFSRPGEGILPDRWIVRVFSGTTSQDFVGPPIPEPLTLTVDPAAKNPSELATIPGSNPVLQIDDALVWTVDFARAQSVGMAFTIPLNATQAKVGTGGFDRIIVFGVKSSLDQNETSTMLEALFDSHHYTRGLAMVGQGTPTNNTEDNPTPLPIDDPDGAVSYNVERATPPTQTTSNQITSSVALPDNSGMPPANGPLQNLPNDPATDGPVLAYYLGLHNGLFQNIAGTGEREQWRARQMAKLLFPATLGYFVEQILSPVFTAAHYTQIHDYFVGYVRGRGPAAAFRIGEVPYGVLPAISLANWASRGTSSGEQFEGKALDTVRRAAGIWKQAALSGVPVVKANSTSPLNDLMQVLALYPSSREVRVRNGRGEVTEYNTAAFFGVDFTTPANTLRGIVNNVLTQVNQPNWLTSLLGGMVFNNTANLMSIPMVAPAAFLSETQFIPQAFFDNMSATGLGSVRALLTEAVTLPPYDPAQPTTTSLLLTLFYKLVRQALLWSRARAARTLARGVSINVAGIEIELNNIGTNTAGETPAALLLSTPSGLGLPAGTVLGDFSGVINEQNVQDTVSALKFLAPSSTAKPPSTAEIDRLFSETLDVTSHRLDAWITAYANRRLVEMRVAQISSTMMPVGSYFGGYAMVENVRPVSRTMVNVPGVGSAEAQAGNGGFIQAPSMAHATAAAVLRNGYLSYGGETASTQMKYAFDLSSARVRAAREILDEVRAGQPLGAAFGYNFERAVQENYPISLGLDAYRFALRNHYPLVANKSGTNTVSMSMVPAVAARNVVDGLALWSAFQANTIPWDTASDLPRRTIVVNGVTGPNPAYTALVTEIGNLGNAIDGVSDLNISEGVLQLVRSNITNAAGNLDALARGTRPPDPQMALSQRGGLAATHRVALVFPAGQTPQSPGWPAPSGTITPRAVAEPLLDAWAGSILGNPTTISAKVTMNPIVQPGTSTQVTVTLAALGLRPLDLVAIARAPAAANSGSILDRRITAQAIVQANDPTRTPGSIDYSAPAGTRTIPQVVEVARALGALFGGARALGSDDLVTAFDAPAGRASTDATNLAAAKALRTLAANAASTLGPVATALAGAVTTKSGLAAALAAAAAYFPDAFPAPGASNDALLVTATAISTQLTARVADAAAAVKSPATTTDGIIAQSEAQLRAVFGPDFVAIPAVTPPNAPELDQSLGARTALLPAGTDSQGNDNGSAPVRFLQQAAQVYDGMSRYRALSLYMGAFGVPIPRLDVAQLPYTPGEQWIGLPFGSANQPSPGRLSLLLYSFGAATPDATLGWQGLVLQDWVEIIPDATEQAGLAFNYDNPGAEAGQAVLVVPPSSAGTTWKQNDVWGTLGETLDLAKIRAVDLQLLGIGQLVPAIYMAHNLQATTIFTGFLGEIFNIVVGLT